MRKGIKKLIILLLIFIAAVGVIIWTRRDSETVKTYTKMEEASLPVMGLVYEEQVINELHGYTGELDVCSIRETIYPLTGERLIPVRLDTFGRDVTKVGYEVRSLDGTHLIERNETSDLTKHESGGLEAEIVLMDLLENGEEYLVTFVLYEGNTEIASYYTRVRTAADTAVAGAIDFALDFSDKTFLEEPDEVIIAQLESKSGADISSLGYADIYSSYSHVLWGSLHPEKSSDTKITLYEFDRLMTSLVLSYSVTAGGDSGETEYYDVKEFYCVRYVNGKYYLMTYERLVDQRFPEGDVITDEGDLLLGVVAADELPIQIVRDDKHTVFVKNGVLRYYENGSARLKTLFSFDNETADIRTGYDQHDIRIVGLEDNGDVEFLVYGYMNRGTHEGETGICYYRYLAEEDALEEVFYIASGQSYQRLKEELGTLSYINDSGLFYLMYEGTIYAIDIEGGEYVELATQVRAGGVSVDEGNGIVAWQESDGDNEGSTITLYYLDSGESRTISSPEGEQMKMMGFINGDLLYGLVCESDVEETYAYSVASPIHALEISNMNGEVISRYEQEGVYLTDVEILEDRICFGRQQLNDGVWEAMEDDVLFCKEENGGESVSLVDSESTERQKLIYFLELGLPADTATVGGTPKLLETETTVISLGSFAETDSERYFAYSYGRLQGIFETVTDAIACIEGDMGVVVDESQNMVWNRGNRGSAAQVNMPLTEPDAEAEMADYLNLFLRKLGTEADCTAQLKMGENVFGILQDFSECELVNLEGCTLSQILYYLSEGQPVLGIDNNNQAVLLVGYYEAYGETTLMYYNMETAQVEEIGYDEAESWFLASGNRFISAIS